MTVDGAVVLSVAHVKLDPEPRGALDVVETNKPDGPSAALTFDLHPVTHRKGGRGRVCGVNWHWHCGRIVARGALPRTRHTDANADADN